MDLTVVGSICVAVAGLLGGLLAVLKWPGERESLAVRTHRDVIADMALLVDELVEGLERCRARRVELEVERDAAIAATTAKQAELRMVLAEQARLEAQLRALGQRP